MRAFLFGSIGTLIETSELQRDAFNRAFEQAGLSWHWDRATYCSLLRRSGGRKRIAEFANLMGDDVDPDAIHATKTEIFQERLASGDLPFRDGVREAVAEARARGFQLGFVSGTSTKTVDMIVSALRPDDAVAEPFDLVTTADMGLAAKPSPALYEHCLEALHLSPHDAIAIEDNPDGASAAKAAGVYTIAFPNENIREADMSMSDEIAADNLYDALKTRLTATSRAAE